MYTRACAFILICVLIILQDLAHLCDGVYACTCVQTSSAHVHFWASVYTLMHGCGNIASKCLSLYVAL